MHMFAQRKKHLGKPVVEPPAVGLQFPMGSDGARSTSLTGQTVLAMSMLQVDSEAAVKCLRERNWRFGYAKHFIKNVELSCRDEETCLKVGGRRRRRPNSLFTLPFVWPL